MPLYAKVIAHSITKNLREVATVEVKCHRSIWPEVMTHKDFSRSAASNRAIPIKKLIQQAIDDPALPIYWGKNQPGMQSFTELNGDEKELAVQAWLKNRDMAVKAAHTLAAMGLHKQLVNRGLEPYTWITAIITATSWHNAMALRCHPDADPSCRAIFEAIRTALNASEPQLLEVGQWHTPYVGEQEKGFLQTKGEGLDIKVSAARCARVSYLLQSGEAPDLGKDLELHDKLLGSVPAHASPAEHQCTPSEDPKDWANLRGFKQYRRTLPNEYIRESGGLKSFKYF